MALWFIPLLLAPLPLLSQSIQVGTASQTILATNTVVFGSGVSSTKAIPDSMVNSAATIVAANIDTSDLLRGGDTLIIRLTGVPTQDQGIFEVKIDESGKISMPHIGSLVAANNTTVELKKLIESCLDSTDASINVE
jgi:protein involved in polysaccharide export with SLBB domain